MHHAIKYSAILTIACYLSRYIFAENACMETFAINDEKEIVRFFITRSSWRDMQEKVLLKSIRRSVLVSDIVISHVEILTTLVSRNISPYVTITRHDLSDTEIMYFYAEIKCICKGETEKEKVRERRRFLSAIEIRYRIYVRQVPGQSSSGSFSGWNALRPRKNSIDHSHSANSPANISETMFPEFRFTWSTWKIRSRQMQELFFLSSAVSMRNSMRSLLTRSS